jgi:hypothetical protein
VRVLKACGNHLIGAAGVVKGARYTWRSHMRSIKTTPPIPPAPFSWRALGRWSVLGLTLVWLLTSAILAYVPSM